jgi:Tol biopolymer transport system component/predicted Ser/Thr protein kinase
MDPAQWRKIEALFEAAMGMAPAQRATFLEEKCAGDESLRKEVESLLLHGDNAGSFLQVPADGKPLEAGQRVSHYEIQEKLGEGGMGAVYRAYDTQLRRPVALKVLPPEYAADPERRSRLLREARAASALNHPNIVGIHEVGSDNGMDFIAMEFIEGKSLGEIIPAKGLPLGKAVDYAVQIAAGLAKAHAAGVVHRDLKRGNIMLTRDGLVKLLDFGLAKRERVCKPGEDEETVTEPQTREGTIAGTMQYMAPEQLRGKEADSRSDIFAFGLVLYEMLTGRRAFEAGNSASLIAAILTAQPPPMASLQPLTPPWLDRVLQRCLAKDPDDRWQSARDLKAEIEWLAAGPGGLAAPAAVPARRLRFRLGWLAAAGLACAGAAIGWVYWMERPQPAPLVRFTVDPPPGERFSLGSWPSVSPDGERILFGVGEPPRLWMYRVSTGESAPFYNVPWSPVSYYLHKIAPWSPDSHWIAVFEGNAVSRVDITGSRGEVLRESVSEFAWGPSGSYFFGLPDRGLFWVERSLPRRQVTVQKPGEGIHEWPQLLPDGKRFLFQKRLSQTVETWLARLDGKEPKLLLTKASQTWYTPPDYLLYWDSGSVFAQRFDASRGTLIGDARTLVSGVAAFPNAPFGMFSVSRNGVLAYRQGPVTNPSRLTWFDRSGNVIGTLGEVADFTCPALSPDGQRLAVCIRDSNGKRNIWVFDLARGTKSRLNFEPADEPSPTWSPDGSEIAYSSDRHGHRDMYAKSSSGTGQERVLLESGDDKSVLDWSSDGKFLFYNVSKPAPDRELWILPLTGSQRVPVPFSGVPYLQDQAAVAPDSRSVVYRSRENGKVLDLYLQPLPSNGRRWQITTSGGHGPQWRGDGREIFYYSESVNAVMAADVSAQGSPGPPHQLFPVQLVTMGRNRFVVTRDGQRFLAVTPEEPRDPATTPFVVILNWQRLLEDR